MPANQEPAAATPKSTPAPASSRNTSQTDNPSVAWQWQGQLATWLRTHKTYPDDARRRGEEGRARVRFTLDRSGQVIAVDLLQSTGVQALDASVLHMLQGATLPPPPETTQDRITITVQIRFSLEE